jgi:hypothetical protein
VNAKGTDHPVPHTHGFDAHAHEMPDGWVHQHRPGDGSPPPFKTHDYVTTWTTPMTSGPMAGEMGPDLDKPCAAEGCGGSWREHLTLSLIEAHRDTSTP